MRSLHLITLLLVMACAARAQETRFFVPFEIQDAYKKGTRSYDGKPGPNYWQNTVDYTITATVNPVAQNLEGSARIVFYNNSPDTLRSLVIRLYNDVYKRGNIRNSPINPDDVSDGVNISRLLIHGTAYELSGRGISRSGTNLSVNLRQTLPPGQHMELEIDWSQHIPKTSRRNGVIDETTSFVGYWYPQISVYDDVFGWDRMNYDFSAEMYNNLSNFDVTLTAPPEFTIWATGELQNPEEVFNRKVSRLFSSAKTSEETIHIITEKDLDDGYKNKSGTWHYKASEVSDFAFCFSDHYEWDAASVQIGNRKVLINTVYPKGRSAQAGGVTQMQREAMKYMSEDFPGVPYPYPVFTTFVGSRGGGMEYPMMANNGSPGRGVTVHEMFHTYFPMYVRINERRFAWMDEGWAQFNTEVIERRYFDKNLTPFFEGIASSGSAGTISDLPLIVSTQFMDNTNYGYASYYLPAFVYSLLHDTLGDELFLRCYREYITRWAKKSPTPYDFMYTFENVSGQDLSWLWKPWFFEFGYPDVSIDGLNGNTLMVSNRGNKPVPLAIRLTCSDADTVLYVNANAWDAERKITVSIPDPQNVKSITVNDMVMDADPMNNFYPSLPLLTERFVTNNTILGRYSLERTTVVLEISKEDGVLKLGLSGNPNKYTLMPRSETKFEMMGGGLTLEFSLDGAKPTLVVTEDGQTFKGTKTED